MDREMRFMAESWLKSLWETDIPALCAKLTDGLVVNDRH